MAPAFTVQQATVATKMGQQVFALHVAQIEWQLGSGVKSNVQKGCELTLKRMKKLLLAVRNLGFPHIGVVGVTDVFGVVAVLGVLAVAVKKCRWGRGEWSNGDGFLQHADTAQFLCGQGAVGAQDEPQGFLQVAARFGQSPALGVDPRNFLHVGHIPAPPLEDDGGKGLGRTVLSFHNILIVA